jgi:hypothetical protein
MKVRLRLPRALVFVVSSAATVLACGDDEQECIPCLPDPTVADAGAGAPDAAPCPDCLPRDGICPVGCIPEGYV